MSDDTFIFLDEFLDTELYIFLNRCKEEILKFSKKCVRKAELEQAMKFLLGSLPLRLDTLFNLLDIAQGEFYEHGELGAFLKDLDKISALSLSELNSFIKAHAEINQLSFCVLKNEI